MKNNKGCFTLGFDLDFRYGKQAEAGGLFTIYLKARKDKKVQDH